MNRRGGGWARALLVAALLLTVFSGYLVISRYASRLDFQAWGGPATVEEAQMLEARYGLKVVGGTVSTPFFTAGMGTENGVAGLIERIVRRLREGVAAEAQPGESRRAADWQKALILYEERGEEIFRVNSLEVKGLLPLRLRLYLWGRRRGSVGASLDKDLATLWKEYGSLCRIVQPRRWNS